MLSAPDHTGIRRILDDDGLCFELIGGDPYLDLSDCMQVAGPADNLHGFGSRNVKNVLWRANPSHTDSYDCCRDDDDSKVYCQAAKGRNTALADRMCGSRHGCIGTTLFRSSCHCLADMQH